VRCHAQAYTFATSEYHKPAKGDAPTPTSEEEWLQHMLGRANKQTALMMELAHKLFASEITTAKTM
jgi:hypothetical protein